MSRKNNKSHARRRNQELIKREQDRAALHEKLNEVRKARAAERQSYQTALSKKKPKVEPVVSSEAKRKKLLAKQLKRLSLGGGSSG